MRKLIIHIGAHKTGSTSIQKFMFQYKEYFKEHFSLVYPTDDLTRPNGWMWGQHFLTWYFTPKADGVSRDVLDKGYASYLEALKENIDYDILVSSEDFVWNQKIPEFINEMKVYFDEIVVIIYVRNQVDAAISLFQTGVVNGGYTGTFGEWFKRAHILFDYSTIIQKWENEGCHVIVKPFLREKFTGKDVIRDFVSTLNTLLERNIHIPNDYDPKQVQVNITVPDFITKMIHYHNRNTDTKDKVVPILRELGKELILLNKEIPTMGFLPLKTKKAIQSRYIKSNHILCDSYLDMEYLSWLNKEVHEDEALYRDRFGYPGSQLVELSKYTLQTLKKISKEKTSI